MKINLGIIMIIAFCGLIFGGAANISAQTVEPPVGNYRRAEPTDKTVVAAANFAVKARAKQRKTKIKLVAVNNAARQVVAGTNYRVCLSVETKDRRTKTAVPQIVQAVVYLNIKNEYRLTSWAIAACADVVPPALVKQ